MKKEKIRYALFKKKIQQLHKEYKKELYENHQVLYFRPIKRRWTKKRAKVLRLTFRHILKNFFKKSKSFKIKNLDLTMLKPQFAKVSRDNIIYKQRVKHFIDKLMLSNKKNIILYNYLRNDQQKLSQITRLKQFISPDYKYKNLKSYKLRRYVQRRYRTSLKQFRPFKRHLFKKSSNIFNVPDTYSKY